MNELPLILIGAGLGAVEVIDIIDDINKTSKKKIKIIGLLDDNPKLFNKKVLNYSVIGNLSDISLFKKENFSLNIFSYRNRFLRSKLIKNLKKKRNRFINLIHPSSLIGSKSFLGMGITIYKNSNIYSKTSIGDFCSVNINVSIAPGAIIESNCNIGKDVIICSGSKIKKDCSVQFGSVTLENSFLSQGSRLMPKSVLNFSCLKKYAVLNGNPAKVVFDEKR
jgi:acetyltransferase-like isoleucine patch superfamily enzyme